MRNTNVIRWEEMCEAATQLGIFDDKEVRGQHPQKFRQLHCGSLHGPILVVILVFFQIRRAVQFLHDMGTVQYFDNEYLRDHVVITPQWIVDVMSGVCLCQKLRHSGQLDSSCTSVIW